MVPRPLLAAEDAVTLTTIHGAKGLEWPVVALLAISGQVRDRFQGVRVEPGLGLAFLQMTRTAACRSLTSTP